MRAYVDLTATATPTWFSAIPTPAQSYVQSIASAEASIIQKDSGADGSLRADQGVITMAVGAVAAALGMLML